MADKKLDKKPSGGGGGGGGGAKSSSDLFILAFFFAALLPLFSWLFAYVISPLELLMTIRQYFAPFFAENSWWIKIVSVVLSALFLWGTVYIIIRTNYFEIKKMAELAAKTGALLSYNLKDNKEGITDSVKRAIFLAKETGVKILINKCIL